MAQLPPLHHLNHSTLICAPVDVAGGWDSEEEDIGLSLSSTFSKNPLKRANKAKVQQSNITREEAARKILGVDNDKVSQPKKLKDPDGVLNHSFQKKLFDALLDKNNNILNAINTIFKNKSKSFFNIPLNISDNELSAAQKKKMENAIYASYIDVDPTDRIDSVRALIRVHNFCKFSKQAASEVSGLFSGLVAKWGGSPFVCALLGDQQTITATVELSPTEKGLGVQIAQANSDESNNVLRAALVVLNKLQILPAVVPYDTILGTLDEYWR